MKLFKLKCLLLRIYYSIKYKIIYLIYRIRYMIQDIRISISLKRCEKLLNKLNK